MSSQDYFIIDKTLLPENTSVFSFHLHIYNKTSDQFNLFLPAGSPLNEERVELLETYLNKGATLAVTMKQKRTFLSSTGLKIEDVPSLCEEPVHELVKAQETREKELEEKKKKGNQLDLTKTLKGKLNTCIRENNFMPLIEDTRAEILTFPYTISPTVSLAIKFSEDLLNKDDMTNRIVAFCFFLAKLSKIESQEHLSNLICAAFLHHIGFTQLRKNILERSRFELSDREEKDYKKHPGLAQHLIRKSLVDLSPEVIKIILDHHERADGSGYPNYKKLDHIHPLALILGFSSHIIEFSEGMIDGKKSSLDKIINRIKNRSMTAGLELEFGDQVLNLIEFLIDDHHLAKSQAS